MSGEAVAVPREGRLAGIDYGHVRVGISICDPLQIVASPYEVYPRGDDVADRRRFLRLVEEEKIVGFVVGLPVHTDGQESVKSLEAREFAKWLAEVTALPVAFHDERFSSKEAKRHLNDAKLTKRKRKQRVDMVAAQIILASFLESSRNQAPGALQ
ncbi:MAG: Holliday junction resolvase RuvX [Planctomycetales bacterium]|nr:Holliday junction resolvase RuvX [Planctomycetales bacterium]